MRICSYHNIEFSGLPIVLQFRVIKFQILRCNCKAYFLDSPAFKNTFWKPFSSFTGRVTDPTISRYIIVPLHFHRIYHYSSMLYLLLTDRYHSVAFYSAVHLNIQMKYNSNQNQTEKRCITLIYIVRSEFLEFTFIRFIIA